MCGIVGYVGPHEAGEFLLRGLRRLEYRGYDSSGVATVTPDGRLAVTKAAGRLDRLAEKLAKIPTVVAALASLHDVDKPRNLAKSVTVE